MYRLNINLTQDEHKFLKVQAAIAEKTITEMVKEKIFPSDFARFNKETIEAIEDSFSGSNLTSYHSVTDLMKKFDI